MTRKEKTDIIDTVKHFVRLELKGVNANELDIKNVEFVLDTNKMKRITDKDIRNVVYAVRYSRRQVEKMPVTERTLEAIRDIQQCGMWFCEKFGLSYGYMD